MSEKIRSSHLERAAYVYVRQSTMQQVRSNLESQRRQYALGERARTLGFASVVIVDEDLGRSGSGQEERPGFERLVAAVCRGQVGAVLAVEASRLARNNRDWHHLVDLCALTEALVIDHDGIYDPRGLNDRLLLGLKGTMSEFELGLIRQRSQEALRQMIQRGEVLSEVPAGFVRTRDNRCEMTPDRRVQSAVHGVLAKFQELGSVRQVLLWYRQERILLPRIQPATLGQEVAWRAPVYNTILGILKNPVYAGAFVHGRRSTRTVVRDGRARKTQGHEVPRDAWPVLIRDHHASYISWSEYLQNQAQMETNAAMHGLMNRGAVRRGPALLAGLLRCGRCGRKLHVSYSGIGGKVLRYHCRGGHFNHGTARCISFGGLRVDEAVAKTVIAAIQPAGVTAALEALEQTARGDADKRDALRLSVEQARYEVGRARRQYDAVDPENRLVAAELEARWNEALSRLADAEQRLAEVPRPLDPIDEPMRRRLLELGRDIQAAWEHPSAPVTLKKRILRTVLEEIVADLPGEPAGIVLQLHWAGGVHTRLSVPRNRTGHHRHCTDRNVVEIVRELACTCSDGAIARVLNRLGYRTGAGNTWIESRVTSLRSHHSIPAVGTSPRGGITLAQAAAALGVSTTATRRLITRGTLPGRQVVRDSPWVIERESLDLPAVQAAAQAIRKGGRVPRTHRGQSELPLMTTTS
jgi:DNA invertase Pin-like site-specific DNA recombinase